MRTSRRVLYVEGGGNQNQSLRSECRKAFAELFRKAGIQNKPQVVAAGSRKNAYDRFCKALALGEDAAYLLVDAEEPVGLDQGVSPWAHVQERVGDGWQKPKSATDDQLQFMTVIMETWLLADHDALKREFGPKLNLKQLPAEGDTLEAKDKAMIYKSLQAAISSASAEAYSKGKHSFKILAMVSPEKLRRLPWADRFLNEMGKS